MHDLLISEIFSRVFRTTHRDLVCTFHWNDDVFFSDICIEKSAALRWHQLVISPSERTNEDPTQRSVSLSSCSVSLHILHIISLAGGSSAGLGPYPSIHPCASSSSIRWTLCLSIVVGWQSACGRLLGPCFLPGLWRGGLDRPRIIICLGQISFQALRERIPTGEKWSVSSQAPSLRMMIYWHQTGDDDGENVE